MGGSFPGFEVLEADPESAARAADLPAFNVLQFNCNSQEDGGK